jgi:hypothetical protein
MWDHIEIVGTAIVVAGMCVAAYLFAGLVGLIH